ncbi:cystathionine beta-lyase [Halolactibacillus alkaliphilus]|uniref:cysteine-S-conjugate beta-lyase n=1 Tax=Halolactibacillus alkaliphilus TaxID=442899 RepID=A0A511X409_9BACI|nr:MalY/PatB family protein [Halolactibacillus alkaliphilus]GEN57677.1 cystathionine beta-lyase [Halolactibacillus alkaliphilus]GGN74657.1 cystathionine beta-lyase [Halolactibacillus alkaliphilus]SFP02875.1 cystathione beta-lyase [Halolactibacillus alkaliphilus]
MQDFSTFPNRTGTRSVKWDKLEELYGSSNVQPLWVADMDLEIAEPIKQALLDRVNHGIFGYTFTDVALNNVVVDWVKRNHQLIIQPDDIVYSPGVLETIHMAILTQTDESDKILIQTPVYHPFQHMIKRHKRTLVTSPLINTDGYYTMDLGNLEEHFKNGVKMMILCSPHNPIGRVWTKEELNELLRLASQYNILILSDEIHADLVYKGHKHTPIGSLDSPSKQKIITLMSPTKSFNLAGLQISYAIIPDKKIRMQIKNAFVRFGMTMLNPLGITALETAYTKGDPWLNDLRQLLTKNKTLVERTLEPYDIVTVTKAEGTYLLWLDFNQLNMSHDELTKWMAQTVGLGLNSGITFGEDGHGFMRMNIASPYNYIKEALDKLTQALDQRKIER